MSRASPADGDKPNYRRNLDTSFCASPVGDRPVRRFLNESQACSEHKNDRFASKLILYRINFAILLTRGVHDRAACVKKSDLDEDSRDGIFLFLGMI